MKKVAIIVMLLSIAIAGFIYFQPAPPPVPGAEAVQLIITEVNGERAAAGLAPLTESAALDQGATLKSEDEATKGYFAHNSPDGSTPWTWFEKVGYVYSYAGENLSVDYDPQQVVDAWMASPVHRANILKPQYKEIGIGFARGQYEGHNALFITQEFAAPASK